MDENEGAIRAKLMSEMSRILRQTVPILKRDIHQPFVDLFIRSRVKELEVYLRRRLGAEWSDARAEERLLGEYLLASLDSRRWTDRAIAERQMTRLLRKAGLELPAPLLHRLELGFAECVASWKLGYEKVEGEYYREQEAEILANFRAAVGKRLSDQAAKQVRERISLALRAGLRPQGYKEKETSIQDQMLWLFSDYLSAPEEKRSEVYSLGEERIIFSLFSPVRKDERLAHGASA
jgi:hypothetical protein